jgi:hypothetical protein
LRTSNAEGTLLGLQGVAIMSFHNRLTVEMTADDLVAINNALNEVCHGPDAIPEWEFETRMGLDRATAEQTLGRIKIALDQVR